MIDWTWVQSAIRLSCYGIIAAATAITGVRLWRSTRRIAERRQGLKRQCRRWAWFMGAMSLWAIAAAGLNIAMDNTRTDLRWALTIPVLIMTVAVLDIWRFFAINGEER